MNHFVLADCNNFYVSCERLLNPSLEGKAVIILSNNDGCVISRSQEAKALGIKMGDPYFKIKEFCSLAKVVVYSSNYQLYGDISRRIMNIFAAEAPEMQIYSIDEAFLKYPSHLASSEVISIATHLRIMVKRWVGIPISLGIGPTKTLSKVANDLAKKSKSFVFDLTAPEVRREVFRSYPVGDVWGIGDGLKEKLNKLGIYTAADFIDSDPLLIKKKMGVVGERLLWELQGLCCLGIEEAAPKKSITCSRSFGKFLTEEGDIAEALSAFAARGCVKLRKQKSCAKALHIFLETNQVNADAYKRLQFNSTVILPEPTHGTLEIIAAAKKCLKTIYRSGLQYKKCGIVFLDLEPERHVIPDLFSKPRNPKRDILMQTMDSLNRQLGKDKLFLGAMGINPQWKVRREFLSRYNTTNWNLLPLVYV